MSFWQALVLSCFLYGVSQVGSRYYRQYQQKVLISRIAPFDSKWSLTGSPSSCLGKDKCVVVYVAPWCGACRNTEPTFRAMFLALPKLRPDVGFGIVVGEDQPEKLLKKKSELSPIEVYADLDGSVLAQRNINSFPTWLVFDRQGKEVFRKSSAFSATSDEQLGLVFADLLEF